MTRQGFYQTGTWKRKRREIFVRDKGECKNCEKIIKGRWVVDHIKPLTDSNFTDTEISLNNDNLQLLCITCHNKKTFLQGKIVKEPNWKEREQEINFWKEG